MNTNLRILTGLFCIVAATSTGCDFSEDVGDDLRPLVEEDVTDIPQGTGVGVTFDGDYRVVKAVELACACHEGIESHVCGTVRLDENPVWTFTQDEGDLLVKGGPGHLDGGINADGSFSAGGAIPIIDEVTGSTVGISYALLEGSIDTDGDESPTELVAEFDNTLKFNQGGVYYNCDLLVKVEGHYLP